MNVLKMLFKTTCGLESTDGLQQKEREALIDLLIFCEFADNHLSLAEDKVLQDEIEQLDWNSGIDIDSYISSAISRARKAKADSELEEEFLKDAARCLHSIHAKSTARTLMTKLFRSDGEVDAEKELAGTVLPYLQ